MPPASADATYGARVAAARARLQDEALFSHAWQEGRALTLDRAIELALQSESSGADVAAHR